MNFWAIKIETLQRRGSLAHGWGALQGSGDPPAKAWLECRRDGHIVGKIPAMLGRHHRSAKDESITIDLVIYGISTKTPLPQDAFFLVIEWPDKRRMDLATPSPWNIASRHGVARLLELPWKHYVSRGLRLIRQRQLSVLIRKLTQMAFTFFSSGLSIERLLALAQAGGKPLALVIDHDLGGGANLYRRSLLERLSVEGFIPVLLSTHHGVLAYQLSIRQQEKTAVAHVDGLRVLFDALSGANFKRVVFNNITSFPEPLALVQALRNWLEEKQLEQFLFLMHDHYCICPSWLLLNDAGKYCGLPDTRICASCLPANTSPFLEFSYGIDVVTWRENWAALLKKASEIRCFSNATRNLLLRAHTYLDPGKISVVPHTLNHVRLRKVALVDSGQPVIGILGSIDHHKGAEVVRELAEYIQAIQSNVRIVIIGTIASDLPAVTVTGPYRPEQLPELVEAYGINVGFFPSICPETFSYVTEEMIKMNLPVLAFDLGAPGERVSQYARGRVISLGDPQATLEAIQKLYLDHVNELPIRQP
jgi:glycosyltransferase involved in cell wall biosynthesis